MAAELNYREAGAGEHVKEVYFFYDVSSPPLGTLHLACGSSLGGSGDDEQYREALSTTIAMTMVACAIS